MVGWFERRNGEGATLRAEIKSGGGRNTGNRTLQSRQTGILLNLNTSKVQVPKCGFPTWLGSWISSHVGKRMGRTLCLQRLLR